MINTSIRIYSHCMCLITLIFIRIHDIVQKTHAYVLWIIIHKSSSKNVHLIKIILYDIILL